MSRKHTFLKSLLTFAILISLLLLFAGAATIGVMHSHDCVGEECEICMALNSAKDLLDGILLAGLFAFSASALTFLCVEAVRSDKFIVHGNLISLKVKFSD